MIRSSTEPAVDLAAAAIVKKEEEEEGEGRKNFELSRAS